MPKLTKLSICASFLMMTAAGYSYFHKSAERNAKMLKASTFLRKPLSAKGQSNVYIPDSLSINNTDAAIK
ncbi:hypothetical protein [Persicobacter psychrovividus]|uniref:Uncharacterized protein n=1 Tax=Persicobacter psychrovividus TaxID=387638 RepID=A0ABN6LF74_9BACT|nr:hypothetical protein PEPS_40980 [Persicobacter psychrovividus]